MKEEILNDEFRLLYWAVISDESSLRIPRDITPRARRYVAAPLAMDVKPWGGLVYGIPASNLVWYTDRSIPDFCLASGTIEKGFPEMGPQWPGTALLS